MMAFAFYHASNWCYFFIPWLFRYDKIFTVKMYLLVDHSLSYIIPSSYPRVHFLDKYTSLVDRWLLRTRNSNLLRSLCWFCMPSRTWLGYSESAYMVLTNIISYCHSGLLFLWEHWASEMWMLFQSCFYLNGVRLTEKFTGEQFCR